MLSTQGTTLVIAVVVGVVADVLAAAVVMAVGAVSIPFATCINIAGNCEIIDLTNNLILCIVTRNRDQIVFIS